MYKIIINNNRYHYVSKIAENVTDSDNKSRLYDNESILLLRRRWKKLENDLYSNKKNKFDLSKIPDIYDCAKFDLIHNKKLDLKEIKPLFDLSQKMADVIIPQEYGITEEDKIECGIRICHFLLQKIDLVYIK